MSLDDDVRIEFSKPIRQIFLMVGFLALVGVVSYLLYRPIEAVFFANPWLNGGIGFVFVVGVLFCFRQVVQLYTSVNWIEGFAIDRPGHEFVRPPSLLASMSALLRDRRARLSLTAISTRSILDTVATRMDDSRDITRYIVNLLIFLGLLGTFWGLANTVPAVVDTIRSLAPQEGEEGVAVFDRLINGLDDQLAGMGTAFASSLLGLAGSLVVGLLELLAGHAQNRFFRELEEWLSSITRITSGGEGEGVGAAYLSALLERNAQQMGEVGEMVRMLAEREGASPMEPLKDTLAGLSTAQGALLAHLEGQKAGEREALDRIAASHERILSALDHSRGGGPVAEGAGVDEEMRRRVRNIDVQLLRILEELTAGRQDSVADIRAELRKVAEAIDAASGRAG